MRTLFKCEDQKKKPTSLVGSKPPPSLLTYDLLGYNSIVDTIWRKIGNERKLKEWSLKLGDAYLTQKGKVWCCFFSSSPSPDHQGSKASLNSFQLLDRISKKHTTL